MTGDAYIRRTLRSAAAKAGHSLEDLTNVDGALFGFCSSCHQLVEAHFDYLSDRWALTLDPCRPITGREKSEAS